MKSLISVGLVLITFTNAVAANNPIVNDWQTHNVAHQTTTLCAAVSKGELELVKKLIEYGANIDEKSNDYTPAMTAVLFNQMEILEYLVSKGADLKIKNSRGVNAMALANYQRLDNAVAIIKNSLHKKNRC